MTSSTNSTPWTKHVTRLKPSSKTSMKGTRVCQTWSTWRRNSWRSDRARLRNLTRSRTSWLTRRQHSKRRSSVWRRHLSSQSNNSMIRSRVCKKWSLTRRRPVSCGSSAMKRSKRITLIRIQACSKPALSSKIRSLHSKIVRLSSTRLIVRFKSFKSRTWSSSIKSMKL